jgi:hypothetical protein
VKRIRSIVPPRRLELLERIACDSADFDRKYDALASYEDSAYSSWKRFGRLTRLLESSGHPLAVKRKTWERMAGELMDRYPEEWRIRRRKDGLPLVESFAEMLGRK